MSPAALTVSTARPSGGVEVGPGELGDVELERVIAKRALGARRPIDLTVAIRGDDPKRRWQKITRGNSGDDRDCSRVYRAGGLFNGAIEPEQGSERRVLTGFIGCCDGVHRIHDCGRTDFVLDRSSGSGRAGNDRKRRLQNYKKENSVRDERTMTIKSGRQPHTG